MKYMITNSKITLFIDGEFFQVDSNEAIFNKVLKAIEEQDKETVKSILNIEEQIINKISDQSLSKNIYVANGVIYYKNRPLPDELSSRLIKVLETDFNITPLINFIEKLYMNPSRSAVSELLGFIESCNLPILPDGHFLAYKKVRENYKDIYTGTINNSVGMIIEMNRNEVDDNRENTCSVGLHFASFEYLQHFGDQNDRLMVLKIHPKDVVSIPSDYNNSKGRCCKYEVVAEIPNDGEFQLDEFLVDEIYLDSLG